MKQYIDKSALVAKIERRIESCTKQREDMLNVRCYTLADDASARMGELRCFQDFIDTLEVKEVEETMSIAYVVTRIEEHSDYVEKVFFDEDKAQEYCDQFKGNEDEYARDITRVKVTL